MSYEFLLSERTGPIEHLLLNRPAVRNAFNGQMIDELARWAETITSDPDVRVVVLGGAGPVFCAGADLSWMAKTVSYTREENVRDATAAARMFGAIDSLPMPVVGRIHGAALGGGAGLAAVCDVVVAEDRAVLGFTEVKVGILPSMIAPFALAKIGQSAARELFLTGRRFDAQHAKAIGLVHAVVSPDALDSRVAEYVNEILAAAPEAIATAKALLREIHGRPPAECLALTTETIAVRRASAEGQEGLKAFLEKRRASWNVSP